VKSFGKAKLFVDEENVGCAKIESWKNENIDGFYMKTTQKGGYSKIQQNQSNKMF
jgi:nitrogen regulatory protein PII-like uncharacterized protein